MLATIKLKNTSTVPVPVYKNEPHKNPGVADPQGTVQYSVAGFRVLRPPGNRSLSLFLSFLFRDS